ncbi:hypothetical protein GCM10007387_57590 [Pseudoduganella albidiflava]|uniref:Uncharacterized protein n=1 Tax=Pseudoduganella albidiflava TaxID=321983 RepID=A0AA87Y2Q6_9BURK|nr:hypothetical protein GCM10007387_57590 [Pseudoduganella albidiflava]
MSPFTVTVRTESGTLTYPAIGTSSAAVHIDALERFGACGVTVRPQRAKA